MEYLLPGLKNDLPAGGNLAQSIFFGHVSFIEYL